MLRARLLTAIFCLSVASAGPACLGPQPAPLDEGSPSDVNGAAGRPKEPAFGVPPPSSCGETVDRFKELMVVEPQVINDARAQNDVGGPWSFRWLVEQLTPPGTSPSEVAMAWLTTYGRTSIDSLAVTPRVGAESKLVCPWLRLTPENECSDDCSVCAKKELDLKRAPFKLLAIMNRTDIPTGPCTEGAEGRFVFNAVDPSSGAPLDFTVIFEYELDGTAMDWAKRFHRLATMPFGEGYRRELENLTREFTSVTPTSAPKLAHLRTNEHAFGPDWELREFVAAGGRFVPTALTNTPRMTANNTADLSVHLLGHSSKIALGDNVIPSTMRGATALIPSETFSWTAPGVDKTTARLFSRNTCNGCHGGEHRVDDPVQFRHVALAKGGQTLVSRFMDDPALGRDELGRRQEIVGRLVCATSCNDVTHGGYTGGKGGGMGGPAARTGLPGLGAESGARSGVVH